jgi:tripartite-type tricarboxylate transporter receptor subunit TctC
MRFFAAAVISVVGILAAGVGSQAQTYPDRPVTIVVPAPPGGGMDAVLRTIGEDISAELGQRIVLENKSGANGEIGARYVANAQPNGYTLLFINPFVDSPTGFDFATDLLPIVPVTSGPIGIGVHPSVKANSLAELIALAKAQPGKLSFGSPGTGSPQHMVGRMFGQMAGIEWLHVPFKGSGDAMASVIGGHIPVGVLGYGAYLPFLKTGEVRLLGVAEEHRLVIAPDVPTISEVLPGFAQSTWFCLFAPPGTPTVIVERLTLAVQKAKASSIVQEKLARIGYAPFNLERGDLKSFIVSQAELRAKLNDDSGMKRK